MNFLYGAMVILITWWYVLLCCLLVYFGGGIGCVCQNQDDGDFLFVHGKTNEVKYPSIYNINQKVLSWFLWWFDYNLHVLSQNTG